MEDALRARLRQWWPRQVGDKRASHRSWYWEDLSDLRLRDEDVFLASDGVIYLESRYTILVSFTTHAMPIVASATVQTTVRQPLLMAGTPTTTIAIAGSQYRMKTRHRLDRMSRDLQVVALDSTLLLRFQGYSKIWSAVQSQPKLRSNDGQP